MLDGALAARLGRSSISRSAGRTSADRESSNGTAGPYLAASASGEFGLGRLSAGMAGVVVIGLVAFYLWTREHQS